MLQHRIAFLYALFCVNALLAYRYRHDIVYMMNYCFGIPTVRYYTMVTTSYTLPHLIQCLSQFLGLCCTNTPVTPLLYTVLCVYIAKHHSILSKQHLNILLWTHCKSSRSVTFLHCNITVTTSTAIICQLIYCYIQTVGNIQCSKIPNYWYIGLLCLICVQCCYCAC